MLTFNVVWLVEVMLPVLLFVTLFLKCFSSSPFLLPYLAWAWTLSAFVSLGMSYCHFVIEVQFCWIWNSWLIVFLSPFCLYNSSAFYPLLFLVSQLLFVFSFSCKSIYFKVFIEYIAVLFLFHLLVFPPQGMWDPSFPNQG